MTDIYQKAYTSVYSSELGDILLAADEIGLTGLWFFGQSYFADTLPAEQIAQETPILAQAREWLDELQIPYGQTMTYGEIARQMEKLQNRPHMSAQAVGGAVGHNGISIIIPCHRVVGTKGNLTGYAGGLDKKMALLELEHANRKTYPENLSL